MHRRAILDTAVSKLRTEAIIGIDVPSFNICGLVMHTLYARYPLPPLPPAIYYGNNH